MSILKDGEYYSDYYNTAYQWLSCGRVPINDTSIWTQGYILNDPPWEDGRYYADNYYYCYIDDTVKNEERATELLEIFPHEKYGDKEKIFDINVYDGRPWWEE